MYQEDQGSRSNSSALIEVAKKAILELVLVVLYLVIVVLKESESNVYQVLVLHAFRAHLDAFFTELFWIDEGSLSYQAITLHAFGANFLVELFDTSD